MQLPKNSPKCARRLYMIDSLRGMAIVLMVVYHSFYNIRNNFPNT